VAQKTKGPDSYEAVDITVLEGLEPVRVRPGMYIGSTGPRGAAPPDPRAGRQLVDEAMAGVCTRIDVTILADGSCRVSDDGRGIPSRITPSTRSVGRGDRADDAARRREVRRRGLQGLGGSARRGRLGRERPLDRADPRDRPQRQALSDDVQGRRQAAGQAEGHRPAPRGRTGTTVTFTPDPTIFDEVEFRAQTITERCRSWPS
jgi:DNA gyrase subunit B